MLTCCGKSSLFIQHFRCIKSDISSNKHIPDNEGYVHCENGEYKLQNGDELTTIDSKEVYVYDLENTKWCQW